MTAWPAISQTAGDSVKVARIDVISAAEELEIYDRLLLINDLTSGIITSYGEENTALRLHAEAKTAQIELLNHAYKLLNTQNQAQEAQGRRKFGLTETLVILVAFLSGSFVTSL